MLTEFRVLLALTSASNPHIYCSYYRLHDDAFLHRKKRFKFVFFFEICHICNLLKSHVLVEQKMNTSINLFILVAEMHCRLESLGIIQAFLAA